MTDANQPDKTRTVSPTGVVTRDVDGKDVEMLRVPISSTRMDREGDRFTREALDGMADQIRSEQPLMFQNHGLAGSWMDAIPYDQAETIGGHMDAEVEQTDDGEHELHSFVNPDGTHPEGERMLKQVRDEFQPIKFSVGFKILNSDPIEDDAGNEIGREFTDVDLMEDSKVGIPANRDASVTHEVAAKGGATAGLPGFRMHPLVQLMAGPSGVPEEFSAKAATDGGQNPGETDADDELPSRRELLAEIKDLRATVEELRDGDGEGKGPCDDNGDCPDGEVCVDGECVPEDEVEDSIDPEEAEALRAELREAREALESGRDSPETRDTDTTEDPDLARDGEPDADTTTEPEGGGEEDRSTADDWLDGN